MEFIILALAVYGISAIVSDYDGPGAVFYKLRRAADDTPWEKLLNCPVCISFYIAFFLALLLTPTLSLFFMYWLGSVGVNVLLNRAV